MINKKNAVITTVILGCISLSDTNACSSCALPQDLKILENILKKPKQLKGLVDKEKLVSILKEKDNYFDKIKGKILKQLSISGDTGTTFKAIFYVFIGKEGSKDVPKASKSVGSNLGTKYITVTLTMNGKQNDASSSAISTDSHLAADTDYVLNSVQAVVTSWT